MNAQGQEEIARLVEAIGRRARAAQAVMARAGRAAKDAALVAAARNLRRSLAGIEAANAQDMASAHERGLSGAMIDRLMLDPRRIEAMAHGLEEIAALGDPVGTEIARWQRPNGLDIARVRTPLGVIGVIYESRPNVTADAAGLSLKAGNVAILRGGSESFRSSRAIMACIAAGIEEAGLPADAVQMIPTTDREAVGHLLRMNTHVDVVVPRGGKGLIERVQQEARMPVFAHLDGNNHVYLHKAADPVMAVSIAVNAKLRRTGVCGAAETILCDAEAAAALLPAVLGALEGGGCEIRGDAHVLALEPSATPAVEADWNTEYLDRIVAVKVVAGLDEAIAHIARHGSSHTDCIVTEDVEAAERFLASVDSAIVLHNASTQFADGGEFGMGAEIGIATGRMHARGPVGVEQLTSFKYVVRGNGQIRPA